MLHFILTFFLGFLPISLSQNTNTQGYQAGGIDFTFQNCDSNPNSYIAFLFNPNNAQPDRVGSANGFMTDWIDNSVQMEYPKHMDNCFYMEFEMHMGGCGGFMTSTSSGVSGIRAALGLPFGMVTCTKKNRYHLEIFSKMVLV